MNELTEGWKKVLMNQHVENNLYKDIFIDIQIGEQIWMDDYAWRLVYAEHLIMICELRCYWLDKE